MRTTVRFSALLLALVLCLSLLPASALATDCPTASQTEAVKDAEPTVIKTWTAKDTNTGAVHTLTLTSDGVLTLSGTGEFRMTSSLSETARKQFESYKDQVKKLVIAQGVTYFDFYGGFKSNSLEEVVMADTVTSHGGYQLFQNCSSLKKVTLSNNMKRIGVREYYNCSALESINFPSSLTSILSEAFRGCSSLESINFPSSLTSIESGAFRGCSSLESINFPSSLTSIGSDAFRGCSSLKGDIVLPKGITALGSSCFANCSSIKRVLVPATLTELGVSAFANCSSLEEVCYPGSSAMWKYRVKGYRNLSDVPLHTFYKYIPYCSFETKYSSYGYTGKEIKPLIKVYTPKGTRLKEGVNYTVSYSDNVNVGIATITVTGTGQYFGTENYTFRIRPKILTGVKITTRTDHTLELAWPKYPNAVRYNVYVNGKLKGETVRDYILLTNLSSETTYTIKVRAVVLGTDETGETVEYESNAEEVIATTL